MREGYTLDDQILFQIPFFESNFRGLTSNCDNNRFTFNLSTFIKIKTISTHSTSENAVVPCSFLWFFRGLKYLASVASNEHGS